MRICVDLDGVLANFGLAFIGKANKLFPNRFPEGYIHTDWDYPLLSKDEFSQVWADIGECWDFWEKLPAYTENIAALKNWLNQRRGDCYFLTSRSVARPGGHSVLLQTNTWLDSHGLLRPNASVIPVKSADYKMHVIAAIGADASIDDYLPTVEELHREFRAHKAFLLARPWNESGRLASLNVVQSVDEFLAAVDKGYVPSTPTPTSRCIA